MKIKIPNRKKKIIMKKRKKIKEWKINKYKKKKIRIQNTF